MNEKVRWISKTKHTVSWKSHQWWAHAHTWNQPPTYDMDGIDKLQTYWVICFVLWYSLLQEKMMQRRRLSPHPTMEPPDSGSGIKRRKPLGALAFTPCQCQVVRHCREALTVLLSAQTKPWLVQTQFNSHNGSVQSPFGPHLDSRWARFGPIWTSADPVWAPSGPVWAPSVPVQNPFGPHLDSCWARVGPIWTSAETVWAPSGQAQSPCGPHLDKCRSR